MKFNKTAIAAALTATMGMGAMATAHAATVTATFSGLFTMLDGSGNPVTNSSYPYYGDPTWGYGKRTQITGGFTFDTATGAGTATVNDFQFFNAGPAHAHNIVMQAIGDGSGGPGTLVAGKMLFDWNGNNNISVGLILDAAGLFGGLGTCPTSGCTITGGALPASNGMSKGKYPIGAAPMATTTFNTAYQNGGAFITGNDTVGGSPMDNGPFPGFNANFDITSVTVTHIDTGGGGNPVPVPAAAWLFGSGLLGLAGVARRRKQS